MRTLTVVCTAAFGLLLIFSASASAADGAISGSVVDVESKDPVEHIEVCAYGAKTEDLGGCSLTNTNGEYTLDEVPEGIYVVEFWAVPSLNYLTQFYEGKTRFQDADFVFVSGGATATGVDAELQLGGSISGHVSDAGTHEPVPDVWVCAEPVDEGTYRCAQTDASGTYAVGRLATGSYKVEFWAGEENPDHLSQYYNGKQSWEEANAIQVTAGESVTGIDAMLERGAWVTGKITDTEGNPARWTSVCALTLFEAYVDCTTSGWAGGYQLGQLRPGNYKVVFSSDLEEESEIDYATRYYNEKLSFGLADQVILSEGAVVSNVDAKLERTRKVTQATGPTFNTRQTRTKRRLQKCKKGFRRKLVRGKRRCARIVRRHHRRKPSAA